MQLLDHVSISVGSIDECVGFYDAIMHALDCEKVNQSDDALGYGLRCEAGEEWHTYLTIRESAGASTDDARHWCFKADSRTAVERFHDAGLAHGGRCDGKPGIRPHYHPHYFAAFLRDPFGNRIEAVCHGAA